jgi:putative radical SAM enzyme (TIGR03279 family)
MKIVEICPSSPLRDRVTVGDNLVRVNGHPVGDALDFQFHNTEESLRLEFENGGEVRRIDLDTVACGDLGLIFEESKIQICNNNCIFCFVHQQPKGMRRSLYIKDDDYRYSFTHGNFVSLSGMTETDFDRILTQRLSPLYISVHATDDRLRRCIFRNEKLEPLLPRLKMLVDHGITLHTQTVICPGINDGEHLHQTIADLAALSPGVDSLAVVPVGLTRYREKLPDLRTYTPTEAADVIDLVQSYHQRFLDKLGTRFVYPADEWFLVAGRPIPPLSYYEEMPQFENGVGMTRQFIVDFNRRRRFLPSKIKRPLHLEIISGKLAEPVLRDFIMPDVSRIKNLKTNLTAVVNKFWGASVTVTGLLTGQDILRAIKKSDADVILLPPNCLNTDDLFLDDISLDRFATQAGRPVITGTYNFVESLQKATERWEA